MAPPAAAAPLDSLLRVARTAPERAARVAAYTRLARALQYEDSTRAYH